jgi:hypothetical protein
MPGLVEHPLASGQRAEPAQPEPTQPTPMQPAAEADEPDTLQTAEMAPAQPSPPAHGNVDVCSAVCDRVVACQIATKEVCMPACAPQLPVLTPEQRTQVIAMTSSMACEELAQFGRSRGNASPGAAGSVVPGADQSGEGAADGQGS